MAMHEYAIHVQDDACPFAISASLAIVEGLEHARDFVVFYSEAVHALATDAWNPPNRPSLQDP